MSVMDTADYLEIGTTDAILMYLRTYGADKSPFIKRQLLLTALHRLDLKNTRVQNTQLTTLYHTRLDPADVKYVLLALLRNHHWDISLHFLRHPLWSSDSWVYSVDCNEVICAVCRQQSYSVILSALLHSVPWSIGCVYLQTWATLCWFYTNLAGIHALCVWSREVQHHSHYETQRIIQVYSYQLSLVNAACSSQAWWEPITTIPGLLTRPLLPAVQNSVLLSMAVAPADRQRKHMMHMLLREGYINPTLHIHMLLNACIVTQQWRYILQILQQTSVQTYTPTPYTIYLIICHLNHKRTRQILLDRVGYRVHPVLLVIAARNKKNVALKQIMQLIQRTNAYAPHMDVLHGLSRVVTMMAHPVSLSTLCQPKQSYTWAVINAASTDSYYILFEILRWDMLEICWYTVALHQDVWCKTTKSGELLQHELHLAAWIRGITGAPTAITTAHKHTPDWLPIEIQACIIIQVAGTHRTSKYQYQLWQHCCTRLEQLHSDQSEARTRAQKRRKLCLV